MEGNIESLGLAALTVGLFSVYRYYLSVRPPKIVIDELWVFPVKSCKGIQVRCSLVTARGLQYDREWVVVDENGKFLSQRSHPRMALIETLLNHAENKLVLNAPGMPSLTLSLAPIPASAPKVNVTVWKDSCQGNDVGEDAGQWMSTFLSTPNLKLVRMAVDFVRKTDQKYSSQGQTSFSDGYPFLLASQESLSDVNSRLNSSLKMANFRPNIVVKGCRSAYEEETWGHIAVDAGGLSRDMYLVKPCSRCKVPTIDLTTAEFHPENEPSRSMKPFRSGKAIGLKTEKFQGEIFFGQNVDHRSRGGWTISVGDAIAVRAGRDPSL